MSSNFLSQKNPRLNQAVIPALPLHFQFQFLFLNTTIKVFLSIKKQEIWKAVKEEIQMIPTRDGHEPNYALKFIQTDLVHELPTMVWCTGTVCKWLMDCHFFMTVHSAQESLVGQTCWHPRQQ